MYKSPRDGLKSCIGNYPDDASTFRREKKPLENKKSLPLVPVSVALKIPPLLPSLAQGPSAPVAVWPLRQKRAVGGSKAPLAVQLEAFVRNEHRLYVREHKNCTHGDTLHITREAFAVLIGHFVEYSGILSLIQDEYEASLEEMLNEVKRLRATHLENESDRNLHMMELIRQRESLTAIISNQQAQLTASQGLVHSLRDQVGSLEEANVSLTIKLDRLNKEHADTVDTTKLLAKSITQESERTAHFLNLCRTSEQEIARLVLLVNSLKESLEEADSRFRALTKQVILGNVTRGMLNLWERENTKEDTVPETQVAQEEVPEPCVPDLQRRIDDLMFAYEELNQKLPKSDKEPSKVIEPVTQVVPSDQRPIDDLRSAINTVTTSQLIQSWLVEEHLTESDLDAYDFLLPPGECEDHPFAFLKLCRRVRNRHIKKSDAIKLIRRFWLDRESHRQVPLKQYFLQWLSTETGSDRIAQEVALNILHACERNQDDPEIRATLLVLSCFLPEELIITECKIIKELKDLCRDTYVTLDNYVETCVVVDAIRHLMPELGYAHMLQLRLYLWRASGGDGKVVIEDIFKEGSHFLFLLRKGFLDATEEFTLQIVEGIREVSKDGRVVRLQDVSEVISRIDKGMKKGTLHRIVSEATQMAAMDVATAEADFTVWLQPLLRRFRTSVLLRRSTAILPDDEEKVQPSA